jgi:hypothetical protein
LEALSSYSSTSSSGDEDEDYLDNLIKTFKEKISIITNESTTLRRTTTVQQSSQLDSYDSNILGLTGYTTRLLSFQERMRIRIFPAALSTWREMRTLYDRKIQIELRLAFNLRLMSEDKFPEWAVSFNPPKSLINSETAVLTVVEHRRAAAKANIAVINTLMNQEQERISTCINAKLSALKIYYQSEGGRDYSLQDALDGLSTLANRTKQNESAELQKRQAIIDSAPEFAIWQNLPAHAQLPESAVRPFVPTSTGLRSGRDFQARGGRASRRPPRGRGRSLLRGANPRGMPRGRSSGRQQPYPDRVKQVCQVLAYLDSLQK